MEMKSKLLPRLAPAPGGLPAGRDFPTSAASADLPGTGKAREHMATVIRSAELGDAEAIQRVYSGPKAIWGTLQLPYRSVESWRKGLSSPADGAYQLVSCAGEEVVGQLTLWTNPNFPRRRHACSIGMAVRDDWQGKGVGTALVQAATDLAERWLNITRMELDVYVDNEPAVRLYKKFGFEIEGTRAGYAFRDGRMVDTYLMARLRR